jgi:hypothetical protein
MALDCPLIIGGYVGAFMEPTWTICGAGRPG